jgi:D-alanyl-D-alanine carboxypeptidase (penicillin-binding protein 5/6)
MKRVLSWCAAIGFAALQTLALPAVAQQPSTALPPALRSAPIAVPSAPSVAARAYLLMDADSGRVLVEHNADERLPPASLTKLMTSYVLSHEIEQGHVHPDDMVTISENAWSQNPRFKGSSLMFIEVGKQVKLHDLHLGVVVSSGNESSVAVAEYLAGSEDAFAQVMNQHAQRLGMTNTHYVNAHGLDDPAQYTSARDLATLTRAILAYPAEYGLYKLKEFTFNNIRQVNRNGLLWRDPSVDGLKTGHTDKAGYCLVASAKRDGMRLISVILGADSVAARERETEKLLAYGFRFFETLPLYTSGQEVTKTRVWGGADEEVALGVESMTAVTIPRGKRDALQAALNIDRVIKAPLEAGQAVGELVVTLDGEEVARAPLVTLQAVEQGGIFKRLWDWLVLFFTKLLG